MTTRKTYAARTKGDLKIIRSDGTIEVIPKRVADLSAREIVAKSSKRELELLKAPVPEFEGR